MSYNAFKHPKCFTKNPLPGQAFGTSNRIDFAGTATYLKLHNASAHDCYVRLNDDSDAIFVLGGLFDFEISNHSIDITSVDFAVTSSGGAAIIGVLAGIVYE